MQGYVLKVSDCEPSQFPCFNYPALSRNSGIVRGRFVSESSFNPNSERPAAWGAAGDGAWTDTSVVNVTRMMDPHNSDKVQSWDADGDPGGQITLERSIGFMGSVRLGDGYAWITNDDYEFLARRMGVGESASGTPQAEYVSCLADSHQIWISALIGVNDYVEAPDWCVVETGLPAEIPGGTGYSIEFLGQGGVSLTSNEFGMDFQEADTLVFLANVPFPAGTQRIEIRKAGSTIFGRDVSSHAPAVTLISPNGGGTLSGAIEVNWTATDLDGDSTRAELYYSMDNGFSWQLIGFDIVGDSFSWNTDFVPGTTVGLVRVVVSDGILVAEDVSDGTFAISGHPPSVTVVAPSDSVSVVAGEPVSFKAVLVDWEDAPESGASLVWISNLSDTIGTGASFMASNLAVGTHIITVSGSDSDGMTARDTVTVLVVADSDEDGMPDYWENLYPGLNPSLADGHGDQDADSLSNVDEYHYGTDPTNPDTDGDAFKDGTEVACSSDPLSPQSYPIAVESEGPKVPPTAQVWSYPNPFNPRITIVFDVPKRSQVRLRVFDVEGRVIATVLNREMEPGSYRTVWAGKSAEGTELASGVYFYRLEAGAFVTTRKMVLLR